MAPAPIRPLVWDPPYAVGAVLEKTKKKKVFRQKKGMVIFHVTWRDNKEKHNEARNNFYKHIHYD